MKCFGVLVVVVGILTCANEYNQLLGAFIICTGMTIITY